MTIIVVTHESGVAYQAEKIVHIQDGVIGNIEIVTDDSRRPFSMDGLMK
jgi:putative ABC transport system ATP-binding protein